MSEQPKEISVEETLSDDLLKKMSVEEPNIKTKIKKRIQYIVDCGNEKENAHKIYQQSSFDYDKLKQSFYVACELSLIDNDIPTAGKIIVTHF